jgi:hypothetical protein
MQFAWERDIWGRRIASKRKTTSLEFSSRKLSPLLLGQAHERRRWRYRLLSIIRYRLRFIGTSSEEKILLSEDFSTQLLKPTGLS